MAASAGQALFIGKSGKQYSVDLYVEDAAAGVIRFNPSGLAGSASSTTVKFPETVVLRDLSIVTGATAVGAIGKVNNAVLNGATFRTTSHLNTNPSRPILNIVIPAGADFSLSNM